MSHYIYTWRTTPARERRGYDVDKSVRGIGNGGTMTSGSNNRARVQRTTAAGIAFGMIHLCVVVAISAQLYSERPSLARSRDATPGAALEALFASAHFDDCLVAGRAFEITAYCPGPCCNTGTVIRDGAPVTVDWSGRVAASRVSLDLFRAAGIDVVAVDPASVPFGSLVRSEGRLYLALDRGSAIVGDRLDVLLSDHASTVRFGRRRDRPAIVFTPARPDAVLRAVESFALRGTPFPQGG